MLKKIWLSTVFVYKKDCLNAKRKSLHSWLWCSCTSPSYVGGEHWAHCRRTVIPCCCNFCRCEESYTEGTRLPPVFWKGQTSPPLRGTEQCSGVEIPDAPKLGREGKSEILSAVLWRSWDFGCGTEQALEGTEQALEVTGERYVS